jgi:hypothetical protein
VLPPAGTRETHLTKAPANLTTLEVKLPRERSLGALLKTTQNLQALTWNFYSHPDLDWPAPFLDCKNLASSLSHVCTTLEELTITARFDHSAVIDDPPMGVHGTLTTLIAFLRG